MRDRVWNKRCLDLEIRDVLHVHCTQDSFYGNLGASQHSSGGGGGGGGGGGLLFYFTDARNAHAREG